MKSAGDTWQSILTFVRTGFFIPTPPPSGSSQPLEGDGPDVYYLPWQWTSAIVVFVGGAADGDELAEKVRRCRLPDTLRAEGDRYRIGVYRDPHTVEYVVT